MHTSPLALPERATKPRTRGLTIVLDPGVPPTYFRDAIEHTGSLIDLVKFGWGTALISEALEAKIACLGAHQIDYFFGGTLFEKFWSQGLVDAYRAYCQRYACRYVEISNGTVDLAPAEKARLITRFTGEFRVLSEVGYKDSERSLRLAPAQWVDALEQDLAAGAEKVLTEARESGTCGMCLPNGELRADVLGAILTADIDSNQLIFEAPTKQLQTYFIRRLGPQVNLANIGLQEVIPLETLRLGLRSETLLAFDEQGLHAG